jgi:hypothetical protein
MVPRPRISEDGHFSTTSSEFRVRLFRMIDTRLLLGDFVAKLRLAEMGSGKN